jgi:hypothetical protein
MSYAIYLFNGSLKLGRLQIIDIVVFENEAML